MPCVNHLDANRKSTHTNRTCKWVNDLKAGPDSGYKRSRKSRPRGKGKAKEEAKELSDMEEDTEQPNPLKKADGGGKGPNPFEKKVGSYHTFLGTPSAKSRKKILKALHATLPATP